MTIATIGMDIAKHVFHVHAIDEEGKVVARKQLRRSEVLSYFQLLPNCLVGFEACATAHYWARELKHFGHDVKLIPPSYVKPYLRRGAKNDAADAEAICEAVSRPTMRFVPIKSAQAQSVLMLHRVRNLLVRQRTMAVSAVRAHCAESGIIVAQGRHRLGELVQKLHENDQNLPDDAYFALEMLITQLDELDERIEAIEHKMHEKQQDNKIDKLLMMIPGIGTLTASALTASVPDPAVFRSGREFAAWLGLTPRQNSTGGKTQLGRITKQGDSYLRHLLVMGARNVVRFPKARARLGGDWVDALLDRRKPMVVAVAVANKLARIVWAMMTTGEIFRSKAAA